MAGKDAGQTRQAGRAGTWIGEEQGMAGKEPPGRQDRHGGKTVDRQAGRAGPWMCEEQGMLSNDLAMRLSGKPDWVPRPERSRSHGHHIQHRT